MKLSEAVIPVSEAKAHTARMISDVVDKRRPVVITQNGRARVIVQDIASYEETQDSMALLKILAQSQADVREGRTMPLRAAFAEVRSQMQNRPSA